MHFGQRRTAPSYVSDVRDINYQEEMRLPGVRVKKVWSIRYLYLNNTVVINWNHIPTSVQFLPFHPSVQRHW